MASCNACIKQKQGSFGRSRMQWESNTIKEGFQETTFIEQLVEDESQMEGTPFGSSKIMNWHLHLEAVEVGYPRGWLLQNNLDADSDSDAVLPIE
ncbi:hypothetical protein LXL04_020871 [Taraxacum kok-saghyz]